MIKEKQVKAKQEGENKGHFVALQVVVQALVHEIDEESKVQGMEVTYVAQERICKTNLVQRSDEEKVDAVFSDATMVLKEKTNKNRITAQKVI